MSKPKKLSPSDFVNLLPKPMGRLTEDLLREQEDCALPDLKKDPLWDTPEVGLEDRREALAGRPGVDWRVFSTHAGLRRGGYHTVEEAVTHIISQIKQHRVAVPAAPVSAPVPEVADPVH